MGQIQGRDTSSAGTKCQSRVPRGPRRLEYVPSKFRDITGIEHVTTLGQLRRLAAYLATSEGDRSAFVKLGCSVSHGEAARHHPPISTYAVTIEGRVEVIHRDNCDPRAAWRWMGNPARAWNLARALATPAGKGEMQQPASAPALRPSGEARYYVAVLEGKLADGDEGPAGTLKPDGRIILSTHRRTDRDSAGRPTGMVEILVHGQPDWWQSPSLKDLMMAVREAQGEIFAGEDGCCWVVADRCIPVPRASIADMTLTGLNRQSVAQPEHVLRLAAEEYVAQQLHSICGSRTSKAVRRRAFARRIQLALRRIELWSATYDDLARLAARLAAPDLAPSQVSAGNQL